jgi:hypothetical protein
MQTIQNVKEASSMIFKLRLFVMIMLFIASWSNISILHADTFTIDEFKVTKATYSSTTGTQVSTTTLIDDLFSNGIIPPDSPGFANGYGVTGSIGPETGGRLELDTSQGEFSTTSGGNDILTVRASLLTSRTGGSNGLNKNLTTFGVMGIFDLAPLPSQIGTRYDIRLSDAPQNGEGNDVILLDVTKRQSDGQVVIQFRHVDNLNSNNSNTLGEILLNPSVVDDQIALRLRRNDPFTNSIDASFSYIDNDGNWGQWNFFSNTIAIFNGEDFTRASFGAVQHYVPEPSSMLLLGFGLAGIAGLRRKISN